MARDRAVETALDAWRAAGYAVIELQGAEAAQAAGIDGKIAA